jgi:hypothetical protein
MISSNDANFGTESVKIFSCCESPASAEDIARSKRDANVIPVAKTADAPSLIVVFFVGGFIFFSFPSFFRFSLRKEKLAKETNDGSSVFIWWKCSICG